jgi:hypothetical protein
MERMNNSKLIRVCETCPWLTKNHGRKHPAKWYTTTNLRRLWTGLRTGNAPGMTCHSSDPRSNEYGGKGDIKPGKVHECGGALNLIIANINAISAGTEQPHQPPLSKRTLAHYVERCLFRTLPAVEDRSTEVSLPWNQS